MKTSRRIHLWKFAFQKTINIMYAYFPIGFAYGLLCEQMHYPWYFAPMMSFMIHSTSTQFIVLSLMAIQVPLWEIFTAALIINLRNVFFGIFLIDRFPKFSLKKLYLISSLTDESYIVSSLHKFDDEKEDKAFVASVITLNHSYWVIGSLIGSVVGYFITFETPGLEFMMTALFLVLSIDQIRQIQIKTPFFLATFSALCARLLSLNFMLFLSMAITALGLLLWGEFVQKENESVS